MDLLLASYIFMPAVNIGNTKSNVSYEEDGAQRAPYFCDTVPPVPGFGRDCSLLNAITQPIDKMLSACFSLAILFGNYQYNF